MRLDGASKVNHHYYSLEETETAGELQCDKKVND